MYSENCCHSGDLGRWAFAHHGFPDKREGPPRSWRKCLLPHCTLAHIDTVARVVGTRVCLIVGTSSTLSTAPFSRRSDACTLGNLNFYSYFSRSAQLGLLDYLCDQVTGGDREFGRLSRLLCAIRNTVPTAGQPLRRCQKCRGLRRVITPSRQNSARSGTRPRAPQENWRLRR